DTLPNGSWEKLLALCCRLGDAATLQEVFARHLPPVQVVPTGSANRIWTSVLESLDARMQSQPLPEDFRGNTQVVALLNTARLTLNNPASKPAEIIAAIDLLGRKFGRFTTSAISGSDAEDLSTADSRAEQIGTFLSARYSADVQQAAVQGISSTGASSAAELLLMSMPTLSSEVRLQAIDVLLSTRAGSSALVEAISAGTVRSDLLDAGRRDKLISHKDVNISRAAAKAFGQTAVSSRSAVIASLRAAADGKGDPALGREVFRKRCSGCHRLEEHGFVVGPDLMALTNRDPQWLLTAILDPNRDVDARYLSWTAATVDGRTASGMIVEETATTIRLRESGGKEHVIPRSELEEFVSSQKSVMPEGLERDVTEPELRHVIAYLAGFESPPKSLPGNQPATVTSDDGGMLRLTAAVAEIRGNDITFEQSFGNVGYWHHQADQVRWQVDVATSGTFDVYLNASCADDSAGNRFRLSGLGNSMEGVMSGTGGWDRYRPVRLGTAKLSAGRHVVILQPSAPVKGALLDLKEVRLVPAGQSSQFETMTADDVPLPRYPPQIAPFLLDESQSRERRQQVIDQRPGMGPAIIGLLAAGIQPDDVEEEYRRIPWIWRVAIAVGKRNDGGEIRDVLEVSVPRPDQPLHDWQAVVIGGGLINGATLVDVWPQERMNEVLAGLPHVQAAWPEALTKAAQMADDETVRSGTRYDALRMVALRPTQEAMAHLLRYLKPETPRELQMGAVSGLVDITSEEVTPHLLSALEFLEGRNRQLALEGLLRSDGRAAALARAMKSGTVSISEKESTYFRQHSLQSIRRRFETLNPQR
ncbi:MAG: c-type cytochrome, partial [Planctomycetaceae bacterium]|nr:c-type cytochrome [Planctomycetaceae bacterium]